MARRRASIYLAVLVTSTVVAVIGMTALTAARLGTQRSAELQDAVRARANARALVDVVAHRLQNDSTWRTGRTSGQWTADESIGTLTFRYKLVDEIDGNLADDDLEPARLTVRVQVGDAVRLTSVEILPQPPVNLLTNGTVEDGLSPWGPVAGSCNVTAASGSAHAGSYGINTTNRGFGACGPGQDVVAQLVNGRTYYFEAWIKSTTSNNSFGLTIDLDTLLSFQEPWGGFSFSGTAWNKVGDTLTPNWTTTPTSAVLRVFGTFGTGDFSMDDVGLYEGNGPPKTKYVTVPGTWRQEVD